MSGTYEPGTIAMVTYHGTESVAIRSVGTGVGNPMWQTGGGYLHPNVVSDVRPLVVLDPESDDDAARALQAFHQIPPEAACSDDIADAKASLRSLTKPAKPAEPTGLGAVVKDAHGRLWVRGGASHMHDNWRAVGMDEWTSYADIDAVGEPLSAGVEIGE